VRVIREETINERVQQCWHYETKPHAITIPKLELEDLLRVCTRELYLSIAYYLVGCENVRYFLIEFFKSLEVIENAFGGEARAISALTQYGVVPSEFKRLKRYASDQQHPFDVGRHAPQGSDLRVIDVRRLLEEPLSRQVFQDSANAARQAIDAYFAFLRARQSS
jgi:hypothetical protein